MKNIFEDDYKNNPELCYYILRKINDHAIYEFDNRNYADLISKIIDGDSEAMDLISKATSPNSHKLILHGIVENVAFDNGKCKITIIDDATFERCGLTTPERLLANGETMIIATASCEYTIGTPDKIEPGTRVYLCLGWIEAFAKCPNTLFATVVDMVENTGRELAYVDANNKFCDEKEFLEIYAQERKAIMESIDSIK